MKKYILLLYLSAVNCILHVLIKKIHNIPTLKIACLCTTSFWQKLRYRCKYMFIYILIKGIDFHGNLS